MVSSSIIRLRMKISGCLVFLLGPELLLHVLVTLLNLVLQISHINLKQSHLVVDLFVSEACGQLLLLMGSRV